MIDWIFVVVIISGGALMGYLGWYFTRPDPVLEKILRYLIGKYLDERYFSVSKIATELQLHPGVIEDKLRKLEQVGLVMKTKRGWCLVDPLVFLTKRDYERALRLSSGDNIVYGGYQYWKLELFGGFIFLIILSIIALIIPLLTIWYPSFGLLLSNTLKVSPLLAALFISSIIIIVVDVLDNLFKYLARERYMVVVAEHAGILFDVTYLDELSGYIRRGWIRGAEIRISLLHRLQNMFGSIPVGDVIVRGKAIIKTKKGELKQISEYKFRSIPYPREFFFIIRSLQLGNLQWRKRNILFWGFSRWRGMPPIVVRQQTRRRRK